MAAKSTSGRIILPDLTAAQLAAQNPVLKNRQLQFEGDTGKAKRGDGVTRWNSLPYVVGTDGKAATVKVGTVTTLQPGQPATVNNSGTENAAVLNFGIPQGQAGSGGGSADPNIGKGAYWHTENSTVTELEGIEKLSEITLTAPNRPRYLIKVNLPGTYIVKIRFYNNAKQLVYQSWFFTKTNIRNNRFNSSTNAGSIHCRFRRKWKV
ncbi:hypothetical protein SAMN04515649_1261 [Eubacterium callanderi]|uniref:Uncharacterized protein n=1 Tax=Eubacterium callanderi TaxID=53442 RepID=A0AB74F676_9FIRM|nr:MULTISPECIES: hypothetical protein [Eubacterium]MDY7113525.1 hypothetical protein [Eubacterium callanderi]RHO57726.1 hypothetical protein DW091_11035 [Eubacterium sp. AM05-23]SHM59328.1 hypothetical protein SAMN04515649_1261 [Eubacterium callanderi]